MREKLLSYGLVIALFSTILLSSCLGSDSTDTELSDKAWFVSLTFANDSIPNLETASFSLQYDESVGDSIIVNKDSLPYLTRIDSVFPTFSFASTYAAYLVYYNISGEDSLVQLTGTDTVDFTVPMRVRNISADQSAQSEYWIKVNVHQVEPELYVWRQESGNIDSHSASNQKAVLFDNQIFYYLSSSLNNYLYTASLSDYTNWVDETSGLSGLPVNLDLRTIKTFKGKLYIFSNPDNKVYFSSHGYEWEGEAFPVSGYDLVSLLMTFNNQLWGIVKQGTTYYFASTSDGLAWTIGSELDEKFPVDQFEAIVFNSRTNKEKVLVYGGYTKTGALIANIWSTEDGFIWVDFTKNRTYEPIAGASIISYDNKLLMFHAADTLYIRESIDEGYSWNAPDTAYNNPPEQFNRRIYQSTLVDPDNRLIIIGGRKEADIYSDVWSAKLNRLGFE